MGGGGRAALGNAGQRPRSSEQGWDRSWCWAASIPAARCWPSRHLPARLLPSRVPQTLRGLLPRRRPQPRLHPAPSPSRGIPGARSPTRPGLCSWKGEKQENNNNSGGDNDSSHVRPAAPMSPGLFLSRARLPLPASFSETAAGRQMGKRSGPERCAPGCRRGAAAPKGCPMRVRGVRAGGSGMLQPLGTAPFVPVPAPS